MINIGSVLLLVFRKPQYLFLSAALVLILLSAVLIISQANLVNQVVSSADLSFANKASFLFSLYGLLGSNFSLPTAIFTVTTIVLLSVNVSLLVYYIKRRRTFVGKKSGHVAGLAGLVSGIFGIGCAACGSVILTASLSAVGAGGLLAFLPLYGAEFGLLSVLLLLFSIYQLCKFVEKPLVCSV